MVEKILIIDDQKKWRDVVKRMLLRTDYQLITAGTIDEAECLLKKHDFILVSINMNLDNLPELSNDLMGFELLDTIMKEYPSLPRIVITGDLHGPIFDTFLPFGVTEVLHKRNLTRSGLLTAIEKCIQQSIIRKKPYDRLSLCKILDEHTHFSHFDRLLLKLSKEFPGEVVFSSSYDEIPGDKKAEKFDYVLSILESYHSVHVICHLLMEIKPDDDLLAKQFDQIDFTSAAFNKSSRNIMLEKHNPNIAYDVFLCHNSEDKPIVKKIGRELKRRGMNPWLDEWELQPGLPWQDSIEEQIEKIKSAAVFVGKSGLGPWQRAEIRGLLSQFVDRSIPVIPVILSTAPKKPKLPLFLREMTWVDFRVDNPDPINRLIWGITGEKH
ncbi:MAG: TIR domain-containing protein [candidate division Zixibacteria bacterium]|nr:TIR domain-containing protein [candidate division Zixibacteria bacterium]